MRRHPLRLLLTPLLGLLLVLTGCGSPSSENSPTPTSSSSASVSSSPITFTDASGREITLDQPVTRAVVANRYNNELIRAIGSIDNVIGVDQNTAQDTDYWPQFNEDEIIGASGSDLNYEQIISMNPQVLITPKNSTNETDIEKLEPAGIQVIIVNGHDTATFAQQVDILGEVFGNQAGAKKVTDFFTTTMDEVAQRVSGIEPKKTIYWENNDDFTTAIPGTFNDGWHQMLVAAGGVNIFGDPTINTKTIDAEAILQQNPDLIVKITSGSSLKGSSVSTPPTTEEFADLANEMVARPGWSDLSAVQDGDFYLTTGFAEGGLGKAVGVVYIASWLYPEQLSDINPDEVFAQWMAMQGMPADGSSYVYRYSA